MSTHALEFMYRNIKNRQTVTYMYLVKKTTKHPTKRIFRSIKHTPRCVDIIIVIVITVQLMLWSPTASVASTRSPAVGMW